MDYISQCNLCHLHKLFKQKFKEDLILVFLKLLQNTEENKTLTHSFSKTNITKRMIPKKKHKNENYR